MANPVREYDWGLDRSACRVAGSRAQAAAGFAREQAAGVPQFQRSYVDPYAKPEMLLPVTEFAALVGLCPRARVIQMLTSMIHRCDVLG